METVNSYIMVKGDQLGHWGVKVVNETVQIPSTAERLTDEFMMQPRHVYCFYHRPDCAWFTNEIS
jgi:hypothetical protein